MADWWYGIISLMLVVFAVSEGWDFGIGMVQPLVARSAGERRALVRAIGPLWVWNETWLVGTGGVLFMAFPAVMATAFSGFYLALHLLLWCILLRGIALEFGGHLEDAMWRAWWDTVFVVSSILLAVLFGVALGNLIRGLPLDGTQRFALALFTDFTPYGEVGILDWYTLSVGGLTCALLMAHGAAYLAMRTVGGVHERSRRVQRWLWPLAVLLLIAVTTETWQVRPDLFESAGQRPLVWVASLVIVVGATCLVSGGRRQHDARAFLGSTLILTGLLGGAFADLYPDLLHSTLGERFSMIAASSAIDDPGLADALVWWPLAALAAAGAAALSLGAYRERIAAEDGSEHGDEEERG